MNAVSTPSKTQAKADTSSQAQPTLENSETPTDASPSLIVLTLRPIGSKFNGNRIERAQEAGFDWLKSSPRLIGLNDPDTGGEIARHVVHNGAEAIGRLCEIQVHIDPENCATRYNAGDLLMEALEKYAILIGANICDGMGKGLSREERVVIAEYIDSKMRARLDAQREARNVVMPDGELRVISELSFQYATLRKAGSKKNDYEHTYFGVPALHYHEGRAAGMRAAREVIQFYRSHNCERPQLVHTLREACQSEGGFTSYDEKSRGNAAQGFLAIIEELVRYASRGIHNLKWLENCIQSEEQQHVRWVERRENEKREFTERMRKGREAAKARRAKGNQ